MILKICYVYNIKLIGNFCDNFYPCKSFSSQLMRYNRYLFLSWSFIYLLLASVYWWTALHISPLIPFLKLITYQGLFIVTIAL